MAIRDMRNGLGGLPQGQMMAGDETEPPMEMIDPGFDSGPEELLQDIDREGMLRTAAMEDPMLGLVIQAYDELKDKRLSMSKIVEELNNKATSAQKYEAMKFLLEIAGSDDKLGIAEDTLLNKTAKALNLDLKHFQEMKSVAIANISDIEHSETMDETVFNLTEDMSKSDKCKRLREEYSKWNRQTNNSNEGIRNRAKKMVELAANLRKKYSC